MSNPRDNVVIVLEWNIAAVMRYTSYEREVAGLTWGLSLSKSIQSPLLETCSGNTRMSSLPLDRILSCDPEVHTAPWLAAEDTVLTGVQCDSTSKPQAGRETSTRLVATALGLKRQLKVPKDTRYQHLKLCCWMLHWPGKTGCRRLGCWEIWLNFSNGF